MTFVEPPIAAPDDSMSRSAAINIVKKYLRINKDLFDTIEYELGNLSSAQPEIIRCKECVYADSFYHCDYMTTWHDGECFCSYGKRRTDE